MLASANSARPPVSAARPPRRVAVTPALHRLGGLCFAAAAFYASREALDPPRVRKYALPRYVCFKYFILNDPSVEYGAESRRKHYCSRKVHKRERYLSRERTEERLSCKDGPDEHGTPARRSSMRM